MSWGGGHLKLAVYLLVSAVIKENVRKGVNDLERRGSSSSNLLETTTAPVQLGQHLQMKSQAVT